MPSFLTPLLVVLVPLVGMSSTQLYLPVAAPEMMQAAGLEATAFGWVAGATGLGSIWFYMSNHGITPALGPVRTLQLGVVLVTCGAGLMTSAVLPLVLVGAVLIGFGYATSTPAGSQILADHTARQNWSTLFSLRQAGVPLGGIVAGAVGGWLAARFGWRPAFFLILLVTLALAIPLVLAPRSYNESRPRGNFRLYRLFSPSNLRRPFLALRLGPGLQRLALACTGFSMVQSAVFSFFVIYLTAGLGYGLALAGVLFATLQAASVIGRVMFGLLADRVGSPRPVLICLAACSAAAALLLAGLGPDAAPVFLFAVAVFVGASVATWNGLYLAEVSRLVPPDAVSEATAGTTFFVFLTYTVTPPVFGSIISSLGFGTAFVLAAAGATMSAVIVATGEAAKHLPGRGEH